MKGLKKHMASLLTMGLIISASIPAHAFTSVSSVSKTATAQLTGVGTVAFSVTVKKMLDNSTAADIAWSGVTLPMGWKNADHYVQLDSTITAANGGGIRIITANKDATASPLYTGPNAAAGGLVDNTDTTKSLALAWSIKDGIVGSTGPVSAKPFEPAADGAGQVDQFQWLFMTDVVNVALAPNAPYRTAIDTRGIHFSGGDSEFGGAPSPNYVYLEANFLTAVTPRTYSTNKLIVEAYTD